MSALICPSTVVLETIDHLRVAGRSGRECIVLWLGRRSANSIDVQEARRPRQTAQRDRFHIPADEMAAIKAYLREHHLIIAAQVHSHPAEAFHSIADDTGALIRHVGALSFVIPWFASQISVSSFLANTGLFELQKDNTWLEIPFSSLDTKCRIIV
jgi:proteasome lid subunit RPN8/RPN11